MRDTLCDYGEATIANLRANGIALTDSDVIEINALAYDVAEKGRYTERLSRGRPVHCGGVWLWPLTLLATHWYDSMGCRLCDGREALAYAMAHGTEESLLTAGNGDVIAWARKLKCTAAELDLAMHDVLNQTDSPDTSRPSDENDAQKMTAGRLSAVMVARCGGSVEQWERRVSVDYLRSVLEVIAEQNNSEGGEMLDYHTRKAEDALDACICRIKGRLQNG